LSRRLLGLVAATAVTVLSACGYCDGALRVMQGEGYSAPRPDDSGRTPLEANATFLLRADGPAEEEPKLTELSGVDGSSWRLFADATGEPVPARVTADSGGQACLNGVSFHLKVLTRLAPGTYTLVLFLDKVRWRTLGEAAQKLGSYRGARALVAHYVVR
jgi:hypothetical protein